MVKTKKESPKKEETKKEKVKANQAVTQELEDALDEAEEELGEIEAAINGHEEQSEVEIKASKPIAQIKKGDKIKVDGVEYTVDAHEVLIDHGSTKEMAIECFDPKTDKDYQVRYFTGQLETSLEFYELQEIMYIKKRIEKVSW